MGKEAITDLKQTVEALTQLAEADVQIRALIDAAWQVLDDMGKDGQSCCLQAKAALRVAYEPFMEDQFEGWMPLTEAKAILKDGGYPV